MRIPLPLAGLVATAVALVPAAPALAATSSSSSAESSGAARPVRVEVRIQRFAVQGTRVVAKGVATAGLTDPSAGTQRTSAPVTFRVRGGTGCRVLALRLDTLQLNLLGLHVSTSTVNLNITGQRSGGALGQLFCRLSQGVRLKARAVARSASRSLNASLHARPLRALAFTARAEPTARAAQAPASGCQVLDLTLGPLNLDLLGLRVDLFGPTSTQPVRVLITADPNGGVLGQVFCRLAKGQANGGR